MAAQNIVCGEQSPYVVVRDVSGAVGFSGSSVIRVQSSDSTPGETSSVLVNNPAIAAMLARRASEEKVICAQISGVSGS